MTQRGSKPVKFRATVELAGKTATGIEVPPRVVEGLGAGKRPAVRVTINGYSYRSTVASMDGRFMLPISGEHRDRAGVSAGDKVDVQLELDRAPREVSVPDDFTKALRSDKKAGRFFESLSLSNKQWHVLSIEGAKTPETRQRRIERSITMLREGRAR